jgi:hypothetical protein
LDPGSEIRDKHPGSATLEAKTFGKGNRKGLMKIENINTKN